MSEAEYTTVTKDMTLRVLDDVRAANPNMKFLVGASPAPAGVC